MNKFPNFFIIGAPKAGTTAMSEYLKLHPNVFFSDPKEPHFFNDDFTYRHTHDFDTYLNYFSSVNNNHKCIGEGSVHYLRSKNAVPNILKINPEAKFIVMVRNPIDIAYAWHSQQIFNKSENIYDFRKAWELQKSRKNGKNLPKYISSVEKLLYKDIGNIAKHIQRLLSTVSKKNIHFIIFDDFIKDTPSEYKKVLSFLDLEPFLPISFEQINSNKQYKSKFLKEFLENNIRAIKKFLGIKRSFGLFYKYFQKWNTINVKRKPLDPIFHQELKIFYRSDVEYLSKIFNRDLIKLWKY